MNTEMARTLDPYHKKDLYVSPDARNRRVPNYNYWAF